MTDYLALIPFCQTHRQKEIIETRAQAGSAAKAAKALDINIRNVERAVQKVKDQAARRLYSPEHGLTHPVPEHFTGDFTIQRNKDGDIERSWMKGKADKARESAMYQAFVEGFSTELKPVKRTKNTKLKPHTHMLASAIIFGDAHLGMLAHALETLHEDHDLATATADIRAAIDYCIDCAPASEQGWFINVGDFTHANDTKNMTPESGAIMDVSARHNQVLRAACAVIRYCIDRMLTKFNKVIVINARGNHDKDAAFALNLYMEGVYENESRVTVQGNDAKFNFIEFGKCLIGVNHGDKINANRLAGVMTRVMAEAWGRTTFRRWWMGHIHHKTAQEHDSGVTIESFHTLAPVDDWHAASGYGAERRVTLITLHQEYGEVNRMSPSLEMIRAYALNQ